MIELRIGRLATVLIALLVALLLWQAKPTRSRKSVGYVRGDGTGDGSPGFNYDRWLRHRTPVENDG